MRVLVCGSRDWATEGMKTDPYRPNKPQCDTSSEEYMVVSTLLDGLVGGGGPWMSALIEGAAPGADSCAWNWVNEYKESVNHWGGPIFMEHRHYPAKWFDENGSFRRWAGPERNKLMLEDGKPDIVFAFTNDIENSRGTRNMCTIAKEAGIPVYVIGEFNED